MDIIKPDEKITMEHKPEVFSNIDLKPKNATEIIIANGCCGYGKFDSIVSILTLKDGTKVLTGIIVIDNIEYTIYYTIGLNNKFVTIYPTIVDETKPFRLIDNIQTSENVYGENLIYAWVLLICNYSKINKDKDDRGIKICDILTNDEMYNKDIKFGSNIESSIIAFIYALDKHKNGEGVFLYKKTDPYNERENKDYNDEKTMSTVKKPVMEVFTWNVGKEYTCTMLVGRNDVNISINDEILSDCLYCIVRDLIRE